MGDDGSAQFTGEPTGPQLRVAAATFDLLSAPTRLHLMWLLAQGEHDVGSLAARTGGTVALVSQHLAKLRLTGLVTARRDGRRQIYAVEDPHVITLIDQIFAHIAPDGTLAPDPPAPRRPYRREGAGAGGLRCWNGPLELPQCPHPGS
jgi:DNA-binding transcriptional ArsR family regulator